MQKFESLATMIRIVPKSSLLNYVVQFSIHMQWVLDCLLRLSFFQHSNAILLPEYFDDFNVACYKEIVGSCDEPGECAICLCRIDGDDEVRELRCDHFFHRGCLDRWLGYGHFSCPVCRNILKAPLVAEHHREVVFIDFCDPGYGDRDRWWLR